MIEYNKDIVVTDWNGRSHHIVRPAFDKLDAQLDVLADKVDAIPTAMASSAKKQAKVNKRVWKHVNRLNADVATLKQNATQSHGGGMSIVTELPTTYSDEMQMYIPTWNEMPSATENALICKGMVLSATEGVAKNLDAVSFNMDGQVTHLGHSYHVSPFKEMLLYTGDYTIDDLPTDNIFDDYSCKATHTLRVRRKVITRSCFSELVNCVSIDCRGASAESLSSAFHSCIQVKTIDLRDLQILGDAHIPSDMMFTHCVRVEEILLPSSFPITTLNSSFWNCPQLTSVDLSGVSLPNDVTNKEFYNAFYGCSKLKILKFAPNVFGSWPQVTSITFTDCPLGVGTDEDKTALLKWLKVESYNRAQNGLAAMTVNLSAQTRALLTEADIAEIAVKGYTITQPRSDRNESSGNL